MNKIILRAKYISNATAKKKTRGWVSLEYVPDAPFGAGLYTSIIFIGPKLAMLN